MLTTYASLVELNRLYSSAGDYSATLQGEAQTLSYDLVNSFLNSSLAISSSKVPGILKIAQSRFYQWVLESSNVGMTDELNSLYQATADMLSKITQNELSLPDINITDKDAGYKVMEVSSAGSTGFIYLYPGQMPVYPVYYKILFTSTGSVRSGNAKYSVYRRDDLTTPIITNQPATFNYENLIRGYTGTLQSLSNIIMLFDGSWTSGDYIWIRGLPEADINVPIISQGIKQGVIAY